MYAGHHEGARTVTVALSCVTAWNMLLRAANGIGPTGAKEIAEAIRGSALLDTLSIEENLIQDEGLRDLADELGECDSLTFLNVSDNSYVDQGSAFRYLLELNRALVQVSGARPGVFQRTQTHQAVAIDWHLGLKRRNSLAHLHRSAPSFGFPDCITGSEPMRRPQAPGSAVARGASITVTLEFTSELDFLSVALDAGHHQRAKAQSLFAPEAVCIERRVPRALLDEAAPTDSGSAGIFSESASIVDSRRQLLNLLLLKQSIPVRFHATSGGFTVLVFNISSELKQQCVAFVF